MFSYMFWTTYYFLQDLISVALLFLCAFLAYMWYVERRKNGGGTFTFPSSFREAIGWAPSTATSTTTVTGTSPSVWYMGGSPGGYTAGATASSASGSVESYLASRPYNWSERPGDVVSGGRVVGPVTRAYTTRGTGRSYLREEVAPTVVPTAAYAYSTTVGGPTVVRRRVC